MSLSLPHSLWAQTAPPGPECPPLDTTRECDVAVVGAGFTGLSASLHLAEAGMDVTLLEAGEPGWGASGRNGGQVNPGFKALPSAMRARFGDAGDRVAELAGGAPSFAFELIERLGIDCHPVRAGYIQGAFGRGGVARSRAWVEEWQALGAPVRMLEQDTIAALTGSQAYDGGFLDERGGNVHPLAYARGLARAATQAGARVHGASEVTTLSRDRGRWRLATARAEVHARHLIIAGNGYTDRLWPGLAKNVVPVKSVVTATAPLSDNVRRSILPGGQHVSESRRVQAYFRMDPDGRFVMGGRGDALGPRDTAESGHLQQLSQRMYPQLEGATWSHSWSGFVAMTPEGMPRLLSLGDEAWSGLGFNGRGVAMATVMGRELANAVRNEATILPHSTSTPIAGHAFRRVAVAARVAWGRCMDSLESLGHP